MKKKVTGLMIVLLCLAFAAPLFANEPTSISIIELISNPEKHHGKFIRILGYVELEFEGTAIYLSKEGANKNLNKNGLWLTLSYFPDYKDLDGKLCLIEGIFNSKHKGHFGLWSGSVEDITRFELWEEQPSGAENDPGYYDDLAQVCRDKQSVSCCMASVNRMKEDGLKLASEDGSCPEGFVRNMMRCIDSFRWCQPVESKTGFKKD